MTGRPSTYTEETAAVVTQDCVSCRHYKPRENYWVGPNVPDGDCMVRMPFAKHPVRGDDWCSAWHEAHKVG